MSEIFLGIDPGLRGGIVAISSVAGVGYVMPATGGSIDSIALAKIVGTFPKKPILAVVELVASRPGQGVVSMFSFGEGYGRVLGVLDALGISHKEVAPLTWKNCILSGTRKDKQAAITYCGRHFPEINLKIKTKDHDGIADAACLAKYAELMYLNNLDKFENNYE